MSLESLTLRLTLHATDPSANGPHYTISKRTHVKNLSYELYYQRLISDAMFCKSSTLNKEIKLYYTQ